MNLNPPGDHGPIVLLTSGTRGDIQPLIALGVGLRAAGRQVCVVTHPAFAAFVTGYGLAFRPLDGDLNALLASPEWRSALVYDGHPLRSLRTTLRYLHVAKPLYSQMLHSAWQQTQGASMLIASLPTAAFAGQIATALGIPYALAFLQPAGGTAVFPSPLLPITRSLGPQMNRMSHALIERSLWIPWRNEINQWRRRCLGLPALPAGGPFYALRETPVVYGFSPQIVPAPTDWPRHWHVSGYWFLPSPAEAALPTDLAQFVAAGPPPVYVGFGSMGSQRRTDLADTVIAGVRQAGRRAVLAFSDSMPVGQRSADLFVTGPIAHDLLFPQMAAIVHHGGAGTTAAALRAGVPSIAVPVGIDQWFWGRRIADLGAGSAPIGLHSLSAQQLAAAFQCLASPPIIAVATQLGQAIRTEDGVGQAIAALLRIT